MLAILQLFLTGLRNLIQTRSSLVVENLALRQQLAVFKGQKARPQLSRGDRLFWVLLRYVWTGWADALILVKPETVIRWHRQGFRFYWRWKSRKQGRARISTELRHLIKQMATENEWGAPRIHGELLKLGFGVSERTISRYLPKARRSRPDAVHKWKTFLRNHRHEIVAMDFLTVPTVSFRVLHVLFIIHHSRRQIIHTNVTENPTSGWVAQQLREAFPYERAPKYLVFDNDSKSRAMQLARWIA